jgi:hypothetical protein
MKTQISLLFIVIAGLLLVPVCGEEETEAPPLDSLIGYWKYTQVSSQPSGAIWRDIFAVYWFKDDNSYKYILWSFSYPQITISDMHVGTWSLSGNLLTLTWEDHPDQVFEIEYTSESVILDTQDSQPPTREYKLEQHPWIPIDYRETFSLPAEDPS